jgi:HemY protein
MKSGLAIIITLILGALAANYLLEDNGYVLINFRGYAVEMSVPVLMLFLLLAYLAVRICIHVLRTPRTLGELAARRRHRKAGERITQGYIEIGQGNFARGEKLLTKGVRNSETPLLNYLAAARAAQAQGDRERRDNWLSMAYEQDPRAAASVLLTQAELQLANDEFETCRATLNKVLEMTPKNAEALRLKVELCLSLSDWAELHELLPQMRKWGHVATETLDGWYVSTWHALLAEAASQPKRIQDLWKQLPRHLRDNSQLISVRIDALIVEGQVNEAETILRKALANEWSDELVLLYGQLEADAAAQLRRVENWLHKRPEDSVLLLTAARLCVRNELWGKARSYFETSNAIRPSAETWHDLGQLMLHIGDYEAASRSFETGLTLTYGGKPDAPRLEDSSLGAD